VKYRKGFTLIELLIVVAIIAILAAIAVPNFLEAQTRAKVSRSKTDMRTIAVAEEAYRLDWNTYTHSNRAAANPWDRGQWGGFAELTTPVAYMTSIPLTPFGEARVSGQPQTKRWNIFDLGTGNSGNRRCTDDPWTSNAEAFPADCFILASNGPDNIKDSRDPFVVSGDTGFPWRGADPNDAPGILAIVYDPTNGTVSRGEIFRVGGQLPGGSLYTALYAACSK